MSRRGAVRESGRPDHAIDDRPATPPRPVEQACGDHRLVLREVLPAFDEPFGHLQIADVEGTAQELGPRDRAQTGGTTTPEYGMVLPVGG